MKLTYIFYKIYVNIISILNTKIITNLRSNMKKLVCMLLTFAMLMTGCSGGLGGEKLDFETGEVQFSRPESGDKVAVINTAEGVIKIKLFPEYAPKAVENFILLAQDGYYNNITFHRVIEDFMIQSGSPDGTPGGGKSVWGLEFEDEFSDNLHHYNGALSMANHGPDTNGSQFFMVTSPIGEMSAETVQAMTDAGWRQEVIDAYKEAGGYPSLDYHYTVFGQIYEGLNIAYKISRVKTGENDRPEKDVMIESVEIITIE